MGSYDQHSKCQGVYGASIKQFFHKGPHLNSFKIFFIQKGVPYEKKCFREAPETQPDILRGGHMNPYQLKNAIKSGGIVFWIFAYINWSK